MTNLNDPVTQEILRRYEILSSQPIEVLEKQIVTSQMRFNILLNLIGYPFENPPSWMDEKYLEPIMTEDVFNSDLYDTLISELHTKLLHEKFPKLMEEIKEYETFINGEYNVFK
jgi:hypothetical protein